MVFTKNVCVLPCACTCMCVCVCLSVSVHTCVCVSERKRGKTVNITQGQTLQTNFPVNLRMPSIGLPGIHEDSGLWCYSILHASLMAFCPGFVVALTSQVGPMLPLGLARLSLQAEAKNCWQCCNWGRQSLPWWSGLHRAPSPGPLPSFPLQFLLK